MKQEALPCNPLPGVKHLVCSKARATTAPLSILVMESTWRTHMGQAGVLNTASCWARIESMCREAKKKKGKKTKTAAYAKATPAFLSLSVIHTHTYTGSHRAPVSTICNGVCKQSWGSWFRIKQTTGSGPKSEETAKRSCFCFPTVDGNILLKLLVDGACMCMHAHAGEHWPLF